MVALSNVDLLRRVPLFAELTDVQASAMAGAVQVRRLKRGEVLVEQGGQGQALYVILTGRAVVLATDNTGREVILAILRSGDCIGELSLIDGQAHSATVRADTACDVLMLERGAVYSCLPEPSSTGFAMLNNLVQRLRRANQKIESLALMDVYGRVARALLEMAKLNAEGELIVSGRISRQDLSKMVGASREMVSRVMKDLEERGVVQTLDNGDSCIREQFASMA